MFFMVDILFFATAVVLVLMIAVTRSLPIP